jgi:hypothetical protein
VYRNVVIERLLLNPVERLLPERVPQAIKFIEFCTRETDDVHWIEILIGD